MFFVDVTQPEPIKVPAAPVPEPAEGEEAPPPAEPTYIIPPPKLVARVVFGPVASSVPSTATWPVV